MKKRYAKTLTATMLCLVMVLSFGLTALAEEQVVTMDHAISFTGAELNDPIDGYWQAVKEDPDTKSALSYNQAISGNGKGIKLNGYQSGNNMEYVYTDMNELHNKIIKFKMKFDGSLPNIDASFIAFGLRVPEYSTKFYWDTLCYCILIKSSCIEVQKLPAKQGGQYNNLGGTKGKTPIVVKLEEPFKAGIYDIEIGAIDGISPNTGEASVNLILRIDGKEFVNVWDDSGRTPFVKNKGYFVISPIFTQEDVQDDEGASQSRSGVTILPANWQPGDEVVSAPESVPASETATIPDTVAAEPDGLSVTAIALIIAAAAVVLLGGGLCLYRFVIRKKSDKKG